jgi:mRNA interferase MazF
MGKFVKGDVVVAPFPYSDLTTSKRRPAFVVTSFEGDDVLLCQVTSKAKKDAFSISLTNGDFVSGTLHQDSFIRPNRLFTADSRIVLYKAGNVKTIKTEEVIAKIIEMIKA